MHNLYLIKSTSTRNKNKNQCTPRSSLRIWSRSELIIHVVSIRKCNGACSLYFILWAVHCPSIHILKTSACSPTRSTMSPFLCMHPIHHQKLTVQPITHTTPIIFPTNRFFVLVQTSFYPVHGQCMKEDDDDDDVIAAANSRCFYIDLAAAAAAAMPGLCWKTKLLRKEQHTMKFGAVISDGFLFRVLQKSRWGSEQCDKRNVS